MSWETATANFHFLNTTCAGTLRCFEPPKKPITIVVILFVVEKIEGLSSLGSWGGGIKITGEELRLYSQIDLGFYLALITYWLCDVGEWFTCSNLIFLICYNGIFYGIIVRIK